VRRRPSRILGVAIGAASLVLVTLAFVLDALFPPDLSRYLHASTEVTARDGTLLRPFLTRDGMWRLRTAPGDVEPRYIALLLAAEDRRFLDHPGVDPLALLRAAGQWIGSGHIVSGGSTLTMQVARLLEPHRRGMAGKLHDIVRALQLERRYSKNDILAMYLTLAPFGGNIEGVRAASLSYFGTDPASLTDSQAALLVALPQSPTRRRPDRHPMEATVARDRLLARLAGSGAIDPARAREASETEVIAARQDLPRRSAQFAAGLARTAPPGARVRTTLDSGLEAEVTGLVARETAGLDPKVGVAILVVDNRARAIRAIVSGRDPGEFLDLTRTRRSPGSALKPFVYGLAFDGMMLHPETLIDDSPLDIAGYEPRNFDREWRGPVTAREALQQSLNVPAIRVMERVGPERFVARLRQAGATIQLQSSQLESGTPGLAVALGGLGINLRDMTMLYAAIADDGQAAKLVSEEGVEAEKTPFLGPLAGWYLRRILEQSPPPDGVVSPYLTAGRAIAFKTGTSYGFRDAWAVGYSGAYTVGVWVGRVEGSPRPGAYGRNTAAPLVFDIFGLLPPEAEAMHPKPPEAIEASNSSALPAALRRLSDGAATRPHLAFPPAAATVDYLRDGQGEARPVTLRAQGGKPPLRWIVNGAPIPSDGGPALDWRPDGPGFVHVTVIDSTDRSSRSIFRLKPPEDLR
jgi:penicillin-binding protein 1C